MTVRVKELNKTRISDLVDRSDWNILTKFFLETVMLYENEAPDNHSLPFQKALTNVYRVDRNTLTNANNEIIKNSLIKTLGNEFVYQEDKNLKKQLMDYLAIKQAKRCPIAFDITEEHEDEKKG